MPSYLPIGVGAGLCAAVLFASAVLGQTMLGFILLLVVPLPKFLAGLGWGWPAAATAAATATALVAVVANPRSGIVYGISQGLPAVWLCYIAYLNRTVTTERDGEIVEWYPIGRVLAWAATIAGSLAALTLLNLGTTSETLREQVGKLVENFGRTLGQVDPKAASAFDGPAMVELTVNLLPAAFAASALFGIIVNFWLAGRITRTSGKLLRPWPDLAAVALPPGTALALAVTTAAGLPAAWTGLPEYVRFIASGFAAALFMVYVLVGLAIVHSNTRGKSWRGIALVSLYLALFFLNPWSGLLLAMAALAEPIAPWRRSPLPSPPPASGGTPPT